MGSEEILAFTLPGTSGCDESGRLSSEELDAEGALTALDIFPESGVGIRRFLPF